MEALSWGSYLLMWAAGFAGSVIWAKIFQPKVSFILLAVLNIILVFPIAMIFS